MAYRTNRQYCYLCASKLEARSGFSWYCPRCQYVQYESPKPAGELVLYRDGKVLVSQRGQDPDKGKYDFPGGFVEAGETFEQAVIRETKEETGIERGSFGALTRLTSFTMVYPYAKELYNILVEVYIAELKPGFEPKASDDVASLKWVSEDEIDAVDWSRGHHKQNAMHAFKFIRKE